MSAAAVLVVIVLWPERGIDPNPYTLLVFSFFAGKAAYRLDWRQVMFVGAILLFGALGPTFAGYPIFPPVFIILYSVMLAIALVVFRKVSEDLEEGLERNEALLSEYRKMKRRIASGEKQARQEERTQIARDIHDSVGHKLTALLMQLEVYRMQAGDEKDERLQELKKLAKDSLEETRSAVKTLKQDEVTGVSAIIALIRKLEAESFIRIQFSVKHGAFSAHLGNEQAIAVYRVVQEALTNLMRHSQVREAEIVFEAPAGGVFRFEVSNPLTEEISFREGFGVASMRERIEQAGGHYEVTQFDGRFTVRGTLPLLNEERVQE
ncbi:sensor histidine kinase [Alteribacter populi]|uniref:sensor histidine kinase n=1 Tax=Alteribacter populi TaxID=2011011 RepID=UPI000BBAC0D4|nr:sensor histidine kinase [Alteribacter populi]